MIRFLVVDDEVGVCEMLADYLREHYGAHVTAALTGIQGARLIKAGRFDLACLDAVLPDMSGIELAELAVNHDTPVLMMSGHPTSLQRYIDYNLPYLAKPFPLETLSEQAGIVMRNATDNIRRVRASVAALRANAEALDQPPERLTDGDRSSPRHGGA